MRYPLYLYNKYDVETDKHNLFVTDADNVELFQVENGKDNIVLDIIRKANMAQNTINYYKEHIE